MSIRVWFDRMPMQDKYALFITRSNGHGTDVLHSAEDVAEIAKRAWYAPGEEAPCEVWWESHEDAWRDGFEEGYKAARNDGTGAAE